MKLTASNITTALLFALPVAPLAVASFMAVRMGLGF